jgi:hypothetical protein
MRLNLNYVPPSSLPELQKDRKAFKALFHPASTSLPEQDSGWQCLILRVSVGMITVNSRVSGFLEHEFFLMWKKNDRI